MLFSSSKAALHLKFIGMIQLISHNKRTCRLAQGINNQVGSKADRLPKRNFP